MKVHDNVELDAPTSRGDVEVPSPARVRLQNYKGTVIHFRNITITPIAETGGVTAAR